MNIPSALLHWFRSNPEIIEKDNFFQGQCFLHKGDNPTAFTYYKDTNKWYCWTHGCHNDVWNNGAYLCNHLGLDDSDFDYTKFQVAYKPERTQEIICTRDQFLERLSEFPSEYAIDRGFSPYILKKYAIGSSKKKGPMYNRCVVPVMSDNNKFVVGVTGRDLTDKNPKKWLHYKFKSSHNMYNVWFAKQAIRQTKTIILVEGPFDCLSLERANVHNSVCMFGLRMSNIHNKMMENLGVSNIVVAFDNDEAGDLGHQAILKKRGEYFNIKRIKPTKKDWGEMNVEEIQECFMQ